MMDQQRYILPSGVLVRTTSSLNSLSKITKSDRSNSNIVDILRCYVDNDVSTTVQGTNLSTLNHQLTNKMKYHTTYSCSLSSKTQDKTLVSDITRSSVIATSAHSTLQDTSVNSARRNKPTNTASYKIEPKYNNYSYAGQYTDVPTNRLMEFTDNYFDVLDMPGHFNTRGVYGQRATISHTLPMRRSYSDLNLYKVNYLRPERDPASFFLKLPATERGMSYMRDSRKSSLYNTQKHSKNNHREKLSTRGKPMEVSDCEAKIHKHFIDKTGRTRTKLEILIPSMPDMMTVGSSIKRKQKPIKDGRSIEKRESVDVSTQTILDLYDETQDEFLY